MAIFNNALGFAVLTGPLWLIVILMAIGIWLGIKVAKRIKTTGAKIGVGLAVFIAVLVLPFADEIAGRIYLSHLCATEAGVKVYQTVELPKEYWDESGNPRFFNRYGNLDHEFWRRELVRAGGETTPVSNALAIEKRVSKVQHRSSQKELAEIVNFFYWGGWIMRNFTPHNSGSSCDFIHAENFDRSFYGQLFRPAAHSR